MLFACAQATSTNITAVDTAGGSGITDDAAGCHAAHQRVTPPCHSSEYKIRTLAHLHSKTKLILGVFLNRPVPQSRAASRKGDIRES